jgi:hypothetical protein
MIDAFGKAFGHLAPSSREPVTGEQPKYVSQAPGRDLNAAG